MIPYQVLGRYRILLTILLLLIPGNRDLIAGPGDSPPSALEAGERWFVLTIAEAPVGSVREARESAEGGIVTRSEMKLALNRMGSLTEMATSVATVEGADGRMRSLEFEMKLSSQTTRMKARIGEGVVTITSEAGGASFERALEYSGTLIGPVAAARLSAGRLLRPGDRIAYRTFAAEIGAVAGVTREVKAAGPIEVEGRAVPSVEVEEVVEGSPVTTRLWLDAGGNALRTETPGPFGVMKTYRASAEVARLAEGGGELPGESYGATILRTQIRLPHARRISRMVLELTHRNPSLGWPEMEGPGQKVLSSSPDRLVLAVERPAPSAPVTLPLGEAARARDRIDLEPNAFIQSDEPRLVETARAIVGEERDLWKAAKRLERWVSENMQFDMGVVLAPSVEVFEKRRGTCTEYATLLTTLARAAGIPARYVMGYVYLSGMFGGHAWTEVRVGDDWIPLDGVTVSEGPADAARFAFVWSSLDEGIGRLSMGPGARVYGQIDLRVLEYTVDGGPSIQTADVAQPWVVDGDLYRDAGLGLELRKPAAFRFTDLGKVWPEDVVVGLEGPEGQTASLRQGRRRWFEEPRAGALKRLEEAVPGGVAREASVGARRAFVMESPERAALAVPDGGEMWLLTVEGQDAPALLRALAGDLKLTEGRGKS